jgi:hypothetical protein
VQRSLRVKISATSAGPESADLSCFFYFFATLWKNKTHIAILRDYYYYQNYSIMPDPLWCISMMANSQTCLKCGSPVTPGMKFCESCGAKIEALPACPQCGATLIPNAKFCESCGARVGPAAAPVVPAPVEAVPVAAPVTPPVQKVPETPPVPAAVSAAEPPVNEEEKIVPAPVEKPAPPEPPVKEEKSAPAPVEKPVIPEPTAKAEEKTAPAAATIKTPPKPEKVREMPRETGPKKPVPQATMIVAGIVILAILGAVVYFGVLPMMAGPAPTGQNQQTPAVTTVPAGSLATPAPTAAVSTPGTGSLIPGPTQVPPSNRVVVLDPERDPISSIVTVTFRGGEGQYGVREIVVTLTRSDGTSETKTFKPTTVGSGVTFQGTPKTDRIEATSYFFTGEQYKILDQIFEYKKRSG